MQQPGIIEKRKVCTEAFDKRVDSMQQLNAIITKLEANAALFHTYRFLPCEIVEEISAPYKLNRREMYGLILRLYDYTHANNSSAIHDILVDNFESLACGIDGHCSPICITKFDGDPADSRLLTLYARGGMWIYEDTYSGAY